MKVLIDIPEEAYNRLLAEQHLPNSLDIEWCIIHGTPISDNATNGDVLKIMFPNEEIYKGGFGYDLGDVCTIDFDWWNSQYQKEGNE